jgi:hypothetical protein
VILRQPIGQRILRYASLDDVAIWGVLAVILTDGLVARRAAGELSARIRSACANGKAQASCDAFTRLYAFAGLDASGLDASGLDASRPGRLPACTPPGLHAFSGPGRLYPLKTGPCFLA